MVHALNPLNPDHMVQAFGLAGIFLILFIETGLLVGFFLPGDSLVFLAGVVSAGAATNLGGVNLPLPALLIGCPISAVLGAQLGYYLGVKAKRNIVKAKHRDRLRRAEEYFNRFGAARSIVLARFVGIIRTFINPAAGILGMPVKKFFLWNVVGAFLWTESLILAGYFVGDLLPMDRYLGPIIIGIVLLATIPGVVGVLRVRTAGRAETPPETSAEAADHEAERLARTGTE